MQDQLLHGEALGINSARTVLADAIALCLAFVENLKDRLNIRMVLDVVRAKRFALTSRLHAVFRLAGASVGCMGSEDGINSPWTHASSFSNADPNPLGTSKKPLSKDHANTDYCVCLYLFVDPTWALLRYGAVVAPHALVIPKSFEMGSNHSEIASQIERFLR